MAQKSTAMTVLDELSGNMRITVRRPGAVRQPARAVVYWMQHAQRMVDNAALDVATEAANLPGLPVVAYFQVIPAYPNANLRHYHFLQQGLVDAAADAAERGIGLVIRQRMPDGSGGSLEAFLEEVEAALVVGDENPCREPERWRQGMARRLRIPYWTVDADVVVPSKVFNRSFVLLHHFRPHMNRALAEFLTQPKRVVPLHRWEPRKAPESYPLARDITAGFTKLDRTVGPVDTFTGGSRRALEQLERFVLARLADYPEKRNHPELDFTSQLSPYLHFGHISPLRIALRVRAAEREGRVTAEAATKYLEQVIHWRELAVLFVRHEPNYDSWECAAEWARKTLIEHTADSRMHYDKAKLERAETHDELWNAAHRQMVATGWMHNYMRMYWAKKILEWAPDPERAFAWAVEWNDRYQLDGRDPNGYAGIAWAIVGRHDRPWFNRPVYGLVRPMSGASLRKKFNAQAYIRQQFGEW